MIYSLAELKIEYSGLFGEVEKISTEYLSSGEPDLKIGINKEDIETEREIAEQPFPDRVLESTAFYRKLAEFLPKKQAFVLHSALFDIDGEGVAFGALSGTGKTTHIAGRFYPSKGIYPACAGAVSHAGIDAGQHDQYHCVRELHPPQQYRHFRLRHLRDVCGYVVRCSRFGTTGRSV